MEVSKQVRELLKPHWSDSWGTMQGRKEWGVDSEVQREYTQNRAKIARSKFNKGDERVIMGIDSG